MSGSAETRTPQPGPGLSSSERAFNAGVEAVLDVVARSVATIAARDNRLATGFAIAALEELAAAGRALLITSITIEATDERTG